MNIIFAVLFVFSDDIDRCVENLKFDCKMVFVGQDYAGYKNGGHLYLMSQSQHSIIANSSFSRRGAWLNNNPNKLVIAPKRWTNNTEQKIKDIIPEGWIMF